MRPVPSPNPVSLTTTTPVQTAAAQAPRAPRHAITVQSSPPRPVMQQSRSADQVSTYPFAHPDVPSRAQTDPVAPISLHSAATTGELGLMGCGAQPD